MTLNLKFNVSIFKDIPETFINRINRNNCLTPGKHWPSDIFSDLFLEKTPCQIKVLSR